MARRNFQSGAWAGFYAIDGKRIKMVLSLDFGPGEVISGNGTDENGLFSVSGSFKATPPYNATLSRSTALGDSIEMTGFRESKTGGIFGTWRGPGGGGDFHISPTKATSEEHRRMMESARTAQRETLVGMGFPTVLCSEALDACENNLDRAMEYCISHHVPGGGDAWGVADAAIADPEKVSQLLGMGFEEEAAKTALLATGNNLDSALNFLFG